MTQATRPPQAPMGLSAGDDAASARSRRLRWAWALFAAALLFRLLYDGWRQIVPDEAMYWAWSRHLAWGYLDHPPMVGLLIRISTWILGSTELGVRFFAAVLTLGAAGIIVWLTLRLTGDARAALWAALLLLASPLVALLATVMTPDAPTIFFSACGLACAVLLADAPPEAGGRVARLWLLFGVFCGLAMQAKYTAVLLPFAVVMALLTTPRGRGHFRRPWIYLAAVVALLIFSPVIYWNAQHHWVSFRFQLNHGLGEHEPESAAPRGALLHWAIALGRVGAYAAGQVAAWNPVMISLGATAGWWVWRRRETLPLSRWVLLWCSAVPLAFFGLASIRSMGQMNWPAFGYFPLTLLTAEYVAQTWAGRRMHWMKTGLIVAVVASVIVQFPEIMSLARLRPPSKFDEIFGWRDMGRRIEGVRGGLPVLCNLQRDSGLASFYLPGQPDVWACGVGSRPVSYEYFADKPDYRSYPRLLFVGMHVGEFCKQYGFTFAPADKHELRTQLPTGRTRLRMATVCTRLPGGPTTTPAPPPPHDTPTPGPDEER